MKTLITCLVILSSLSIFATEISAQQKDLNQFINIVNPVRISSYTQNPAASFKSQYSEVAKRNLPATWLLTYDAISDDNLSNLAKKMDQSQELGLFLEITLRLASDSGVIYSKTDSWHRANSVFLSGYAQEDRIRLIDTIFERFKNSLGFYPSSVGGWWVDSFSLGYMVDKYKITANLGLADQFSTDGYQVWGQYFSVPFYPSKFHAGIPARTLANKLNLVTFQWAARDPLNGYGRGPASLFSTQDYFTINLKDDYFQKLVNLYAKKGNNQFGQITVGLEGDLTPGAYEAQFGRQLDIIANLKSEGLVDIVTMKDFADWYKNSFPTLSPPHLLQRDDFLGKKVKVIWYQSPSFRINITYNSDTKETRVRDFRTYHDNFQEPYYVSPNRDLNLSINLPSQIDSVSNPDEEWMMFIDSLENIDSTDESVILSYKEHKIQLTKESIEITGDINKVPKLLTDSPLINAEKLVNRIHLRPKASFNFPKQGLIFRSLTQEATYFLRQRKVILGEVLVALLFSTVVLFISKRKMSVFYKTVIIGGAALLIIGASYKWYFLNSQLYFVNQSELDALNRLKLMSGKRIVVFDKVCLQCSWHTTNMPAIFANKRNYIRQITGKDIVYNSSVFDAKTRPEAKKELDKLNADYIYLVRFEDYVELAPFSPGDLNIEEIYANANAQIWKVKKS